MRDVIIADDDASFARRLAAALRDEGYVPFVVADAVAYLDILRTRKRAIVVLEPNLPGGSWFNVIGDIAAHNCQKRAMICTNYISSALIRCARESNINALYKKPVDCRAIVERVTSIGSDSDEQIIAEFPTLGIRDALAHVEWEHINWVIFSNAGNMTKAARALKIPRQSLYRKIRKLPLFT